jgi:Caspase domain
MTWIQPSKGCLGGAVLGLVLLYGIPAPAQAPKTERPTYAVGDKWIRSDGAFDLIRIEGGRYVFAADGGREVHLSRDLGVAKVVRGGKVLLELDPPPGPTWPLELGRSGVTWLTLKSLDPQLGQSLVRWSWKVDAYQDVRVPAGVFKAFRITQVLEPRFLTVSPQSRRLELQLWYAPAIQQLVRADGNDPAGLAFQAVAVDGPTAAPLAVALADPKDQGRVTAERITLTGKVTGGADLLRIAVTLNGAEVTRREEPATPGKDVPLSLPVKLAPGRNTVIVTATDGAGVSRQEGRVIFYDKPAPAVAAAPPTPAAPATPSPPAPAARPPAPAPAPKPPASATPAAPTPAAPPTATPAPAPPTPASPAPPVAAAPEPSRAPAETPRPAAPPPAPAPPAIAARPPEPAPRPLAPFRIAISTPANQARVEQDTVTFAAVVHGGTGVRQVLITANGVELWRQDNRTQQPSMAVNLPVKLAEGQNTLVVTAAESDGTMHQEMRTIHHDKLVPLAVDVRYPEDRARVTDEASVVAAVARSSKGIGRITVTLNGAEVHQQEERSPQKSMAVSAPLTLREGANAIVVTAREPDGALRQEVRTVILERAKPAVPAAPPAPPPPPPSTQWAVVIGVGAYESSAVPRLRYAVADADAIYKTLLAAGFKKENVLLLTDRTERKPTLRNIKWALGTFLARSANKDDLVMIYFAGHGASEVDQRGIERDGLSKYLVPLDADPDDLYSTALPMDEMQNVLARIEAERVTVFLDACYSGAAGGRTFASTKTRSVSVDEIFLDRLARSKGRAIVTASRPTELSIELAELGHGIFTYYLVRGLQGYADNNRDGVVSLQELYEYLAQEVARKSRQVGGNQHPMLKGELEGVLPLTRTGKRN